MRNPTGVGRGIRQPKPKRGLRASHATGEKGVIIKEKRPGVLGSKSGALASTGKNETNLGD